MLACVEGPSPARPSGPALTSANQFARRFTFKLNYDLLRRDLEQHQIIRKFGL